MKPDVLLIVVGIVLLILLFVVMILWILKSIGGIPSAEVKATIHGLGSSLGVKGAGLIGSFLAIAVLAFIAIYFLAKLTTQ